MDAIKEECHYLRERNMVGGLDNTTLGKTQIEH